ncbi:MAG TPA: transcription antitermination factor NusB [Bacteroidales bacterium]|jgi:N utilization substance protein B|nr:transcription antitermination factor NusB [Bacteroidales bacterium]
MINRRLIRIKTLQTVYSYRKSDTKIFAEHYKEFNHSIEKSYELYLLFLQLLPELQHYAHIRIDQIKNRIIKDDNEWQRLLPFANNLVIQQIQSNSQFQSLVKKHTISWSHQQPLIKQLFKTIVQSSLYDTYIQSLSTYENDKKFVRKVLSSIILESEDIYQFLEEYSIYWNDEIEYIISIVEKTIKQFKETVAGGGEILPKYKDEEIEHFSKTLFTKTIEKWNEYNVYIDKKLENWEQERVAEIDVILLQIAITEAVEFCEIPLKATLNEYIELAKWYSTEKSNMFVNGLLHTIFKELRQQKIIVKKGRGLLE